MSADGSYDPSIESPRSGSPILIPPPMLDQDSSVEEVPPPSRQLAQALAEADTPHPPISPRTAGTILAQHADNPTAVQEVAISLKATAHRREGLLSQQLRDSQRRAGTLQLNLLRKEEEVRRLQERLGVVDVPEGFEHNEKNISINCPTSTGQFVTPMWVRRRGDGEVEMHAGREGEEPTYVAELFLEPDYSQEPTDPMPGWFLNLLHGANGSYHTLAQAAYALPHWLAYSEVVQYRKEETALRHLQNELKELSIRVEASRACLATCCHCMEAWDLPNQLRNLEGRSTLHHNHPLAPQYARCAHGFPNHLSGHQACLPAAGASA